MINSKLVFAALITFAVLAMGFGSCTEPSKYCQLYTTSKLQAECTQYCKTNTELGLDADAKAHEELVQICQFAQASYLSSGRTGNTAMELILECDRQFSDSPDRARACRLGITAEDLRFSRNSIGTAGDRETGNRSGK